MIKADYCLEKYKSEVPVGPPIKKDGFAILFYFLNNVLKGLEPSR